MHTKPFGAQCPTYRVVDNMNGAGRQKRGRPALHRKADLTPRGHRTNSDNQQLAFERLRQYEYSLMTAVDAAEDADRSATPSGRVPNLDLSSMNPISSTRIGSNYTPSARGFNSFRDTTGTHTSRSFSGTQSTKTASAREPHPPHTFRPRHKVSSVGRLYRPVKASSMSAVGAPTQQKESGRSASSSEFPFPWMQTAGYVEGQQRSVAKTRPLLSGEEEMISTSQRTSFLPLDAFDDITLDTHTPEEWVALGSTRYAHFPGTPAQSKWFLGNEKWEWRPCYVVGYQGDTHVFEICWAHDVSRKKWVTRFNLKFDAESEERWMARLERARELRDEVEAQVRYFLFVDKMAEDIITPVSEEQIERIVRLIAPVFHARQIPFLDRLVEEFRIEYVRIQKGIGLDYRMQDNTEMDRLAPLKLRAPPVPTSDVPECGVPQIRGYSRDAFLRNRDVAWGRMKQSNPALYRALVGIVTLWTDDFNDYRFCDVTFRSRDDKQTLTFPCSPVDLLEHEKAVCDAIVGMMNSDWSSDTSLKIQDVLFQDEMYNFMVSDYEEFVHSDLYRFVTLVRSMMQQRLRNTVYMSIVDWSVMLFVCMESVKEFREDKRLPTGASFQSAIMSKFPEVAMICDSIFGRLSIELDDDEDKPVIELFRLTLTSEQCSGDAIEQPSVMCYDPPLSNVYEAVVGLVEYMVSKSNQSIDDITSSLLSILEIPSRSLAGMDTSDPFVAYVSSVLQTIADEFVVAPNALMEKYQRYESLLNEETSPEAVCAKLENSEGFDLGMVKAELEKYTLLHSEIEHLSSDVVTEPLFRIDCSELRSRLLTRARSVCSTLANWVGELLVSELEEFEGRASAIYDRLMEENESPEDLQEYKKYFEVAGGKVNELKAEVEDCRRKVDLLYSFELGLSSEAMSRFYHAFAWPHRLTETFPQAEMRIYQDRQRFIEQLADDQAEFSAELSSCGQCIDVIAQCGDIEQVDEVYEKVVDLQSRLARALELSDLYNSREKMFSIPETPYPQLQDLAKTLEKYAVLWTIGWKYMHDSPMWWDGEFNQINPEQVDSSVNEWWRNSFKLEKQLAQEPAPKAVATYLRGKLDQFREYLPLISALRNPGLRDRHWKQISEATGMALAPTDIVSLNQIYTELELQKHLEEIQEISDLASKEYALERSLDKMLGDWRKVQFNTALYRDSDTHILRALDDIEAMLDDQIVKTQAMRSSPYVKAFEERVVTWEQKLLHMQDVLDAWLKCQGVYMYLQPIFSSSDIKKHLPVESKRFEKVDTMWRRVMKNTVRNPNVLSATSGENLLKQFEEADALLELIQKGLDEYLEQKRLKFPRFFFLSNDELLEILSETKDPLRVQPHLRKCFENVEKLEFSETLDISAMYSSEGEKVDFLKVINPGKHNNEVESWLGSVEEEMRNSLRDTIRRSLEAYSPDSRATWITEWPGQVVLCVDQLMWTTYMVNALNEAGARSLSRYEKQLNDEMQELVHVIRGDLTPLDRITLSALLVLDVHARDVTSELNSQGVRDVEDFFWQAQLRYYWEDNDVVVRQVNASRTYGYEYLGNSGRLVITPLTERCYRTLMGALHLNLGGSPQGPAGTGKTETVKDLAKALAMQCVVFNCSDGLDYLAMGKFFKGLASAGAWSCFDEFNRIDLEVLSVIAQQILSIQRAIGTGVAKFVFEGTELKLNPNCAVFITMNPGYAGRSELPDNLKALFRPVAMMVPDYALIAEISLFSYGYLEGRALSKKIVATYRLCSEQLSSQDHYDYGMRAVKAVLTAAAYLKRTFPEIPEDKLMVRALHDVNLPKFLSHDVDLFKGIMSDLFPGIEQPHRDYADLLANIKDACVHYQLQPIDPFIEKIIQLYETIHVRHGLMLVGLPCAGKTSAYRVLSRAMTALAESGSEQPVHAHIMNPKAVTMGQLYGEFDLHSHEWTDGILASIFRKCAAQTNRDNHWLIFDGPVDALWIESMNTVLDDNKKLCLVSGEIVKMSGPMRLIFEVRDLAVASPATVSRCGMVYMEPERIGVLPLCESYIAYNSPAGVRMKPQFGKHLMTLCEWYLPRIVAACVEQKLTHIVQCSDSMKVQSMFRIFDSQLDVLREDDEAGSALRDLDDRVVLQILECAFLFAVVWSFGATLNTLSRHHFDLIVRDLSRYDDPKKKSKNTDAEAHSDTHQLPKAPFKLQLSIPDKGSVFDYFYDVKNRCWKHFADQCERTRFTRDDVAFEDIVVPTVDSVRYSYLLECLVSHGQPVMYVGPTGTGKTMYIKRLLLNGLDAERYIPMFMAFSGQSTANQTQDLIDAKLEKRRKGIYGAPFGKKYVIFVDDVNLPAPEEYGAQPALEVLRMWLDHKGWYDRKTMMFKKVVDVQLLCAMGSASGNGVPERFLRHFSTVCLTEFDDETLKTIYTSLLDWVLDAYTATFRSVTTQIVDASVDLYNTVLKQLLPTPAKSHYTFNVRDLSGMFQGMGSAHPESVESLDQFYKLWLHEAQRTFEDRLVNGSDRKWFHDVVNKIMTDRFRKSVSSLCPEGSEKLLFADYMEQSSEEKTYVELTERPIEVKARIEEYLSDYNYVSKKPLKLVMFDFAIRHVSRICRIIRQPFGNGLLIGVGGSGRQSLTRLAAYMCDMDIFQVELTRTYGVNDWKEDLKLLLTKCGCDAKPHVFLFTDSQIKSDSFLEDISSLLNTCEVPNLFNMDETVAILERMRPIARQEKLDQSKQSLWSLFVGRCRANLHIVICMSPVGDALRNRLRVFPSLVNCCTIDWFTEWPEEGLRSVAEVFLEDIDVSDDNERAGLIEACVHFHKSARELSERFLAEQSRHVYVTPTVYLELISGFKRLLSDKRTEVLNARDRYSAGLDKLRFAQSEVATMQEELEALRPKLIETQKDTDDLIQVIEKQSKEAEEKKLLVARDTAVADEAANAARLIKEDCQKELAEALPILESAERALKTLKKEDIVEVKAMRNPPSGVRLVLSAVCIMKGIKPKKVDNGMGKKEDDYWGASLKMVTDPHFLKSLLEYDRENMKDSVVEKIRVFSNNPEFRPEKVEKASKACMGICKWILAMLKYSDVLKIVRPKQAKLKEAEEEYSRVMKDLKEKQLELKSIEDEIDQLRNQFQANEQKKSELEAQVSDCTKKLDRAQRLISQLGGEHERWTIAVETLTNKLGSLTGNMVLSSAVVSYLGPFTQAYRSRTIKSWTDYCYRDLSLPCEDDFDLATTLGDAVRIREWNLNGLPSDAYSVENAIIASMSRRWPLLIDPEGQANKWIKSMERDNGLMLIKLSDKDFVRSLENAVQFGTPVLLENIGEELDPVLEPLLLRQTFKSGGVECIRLGDSTVEYSRDFRFYMTTKLRNPHYLPEVSIKVALVNFMITPDGLEDQLSSIVIEREKPELAAQHVELALKTAANKKQLVELEDKILFLLSSAEGNILEDEAVIDTLSESKVTASAIEREQRDAERTAAHIAEVREGYRPVAERAAVLFFTISSLVQVDPMYQYSLQWFVQLFRRSIDSSEKLRDLSKRIDVLNEHFMYLLYANICRSLFEKDKLLFSFLMCVNIQIRYGQISAKTFSFFLSGGTAVGDESDDGNPVGSWLPDRQWQELSRASRELAEFENFSIDFATRPNEWKTIYDSANPGAMTFPGEWESRLQGLERLMVMRWIRPDKLVPLISAFVASQIGKKYVDPPPFDLRASFGDSSACTPLIFVLSTGADPMAQLMKFAEAHGQGKSMVSLSLGQGQGPIAEKRIAEGIAKGNWVVLQNCHLCLSWMSRLEYLCEELVPDRVNDGFRLWLTSMPSPSFPVSVLQNGIKMTNEPPKGLRANLMLSYSSDPISDEAFFDGAGNEEPWKRLLFGLAFFHAVVQERRKFGPLGWNIPYDFNESDFRISVRQLQMFLNESGSAEDIPYAALLYMTGQCNYGGRVTDDWDRRALLSILGDIYSPDALLPAYPLSDSGSYFIPDPTDIDGYKEFIQELPMVAGPEAFGMHDNADITKDLKETNELLSSLLETFSNSVIASSDSADSSNDSSAKTESAGASSDSLLKNIVHETLKRIPKPFAIPAIEEKYPVTYGESMNTVLLQECIRFNKLLKTISRSLKSLKNALEGFEVMSTELEAMSYSMANNHVPKMWLAVSYPSLKPLASYVSDLQSRVQFLSSWFDNGPPTVYWISGFFFTQSFLTGVLQNFARKYTIPIDVVSFDFEICTFEGGDDDSPTTPPEDGCYVEGLFLDGARWDRESQVLADPMPKVLFDRMPVIQFVPKRSRDISSEGMYSCPVYKTSERRGTLSTTGHSTNYVLTVRVPSAVDEKVWVKKGVALLCQLDD